MSLVTFYNAEKEYFELGSASMNFLDDKNNIFDNFQEDNDPYSHIIFKTSKSNVEELVNEIIKIVNNDERLRKDIQVKLLLFAEFVRNSNGLTCFIS